MKPAHELWQELNKSKYVCETCKFRSFNRAHFTRHYVSNKHFLLTEFAKDCPRDLKILIASFLPVYKIFRIPDPVGRCALKLVWRRHESYRHCRRAVLPYLTFGPLVYERAASLLARSAFDLDPEEDTVRTPAFFAALHLPRIL